MGRVFISYRREDTEADAGRLYQSLRDEFGAESVYKDVDNVPLGSDWRSAIHDAVEQSDAMVVVIGPNFVGKGVRSRLDTDNDPVRVELEAANAAGLTIIPLLVRDASMPDAETLPDSLGWLSYRNAAALRHSSWDRDVRPVIEALGRRLGGPVAASTNGPLNPIVSTGAEASASADDAASLRQGAADAASPPSRGKTRPGEQSELVRAVVGRHWIGYFEPTWLVLLGIAGLVSPLDGDIDASWANLGLGILAIVAGGVLAFWKAGARYEVTDRHVRIRKGLRSKIKRAIPIDRIATTTVEESGGFVNNSSLVIRLRDRVRPVRLQWLSDANVLQSALAEIRERAQ